MGLRGKGWGVSYGFVFCEGIGEEEFCFCGFGFVGFDVFDGVGGDGLNGNGGEWDWEAGGDGEGKVGDGE